MVILAKHTHLKYATCATHMKHIPCASLFHTCNYFTKVCTLHAPLVWLVYSRNKHKLCLFNNLNQQVWSTWENRACHSILHIVIWCIAHRLCATECMLLNHADCLSTNTINRTNLSYFSYWLCTMLMPFYINPLYFCFTSLSSFRCKHPHCSLHLRP